MAFSDADDLTRALHASAEGDLAAREHLMEAVYRELHRLASHILSGERNADVLQTTVLLNDALMQLFGGKPLLMTDRRHLLNTAARAMRNILVDHARRRHTQKRDGLHVPLEDGGAFSVERSVELVKLDDALKILAGVDPQAAAVVEQKFFGGYTEAETAENLGVPAWKVREDWEYARAWLHDHLSS
jgi:RNA polymerase sigma factor (TIGR02999 family)